MLQTLAVAAMIFTQVFTFICVPLIFCYIIFWTSYWWTCILYITWYSTMDKDSALNGSRRSDWVRSWSWWIYAKNYYPLKVVKCFEGELDPKRNYLFSFFPHGLLATSAFLTMGTSVTEMTSLFPKHKTYLHSISAFYKLPVLRELGLTAGGMSASRDGLETILGNKNGGNISALVVGGAQEAYYSKPGVYKVLLKKRKGFIKIALREGSPLVPVYCFGENQLFSQAEFDDNSLIQRFREIVRKTFGFCLIYPIGRKDLLGLVPHRTPLTVAGEFKKLFCLKISVHFVVRQFIPLIIERYL